MDEIKTSIEDMFLYSDDNGITYLDYTTMRCHGVSPSRGVAWTKQLPLPFGKISMSVIANSVYNKTAILIDVPPVGDHKPRLCPIVNLNCNSKRPSCRIIRTENKIISEICLRLEENVNLRTIDKKSDEKTKCKISKDLHMKNSFSMLLVLEKNKKITFHNPSKRQGSWSTASCQKSTKQNMMSCGSKTCPPGEILAEHDYCDIPNVMTITFLMAGLDLTSFSVVCAAIESAVAGIDQLSLNKTNNRIGTLNSTVVYVYKYDVIKISIIENNLEALKSAQVIEARLIQMKIMPLPKWIEICYFVIRPLANNKEETWKVCNTLQGEDMINKMVYNSKGNTVSVQFCGYVLKFLMTIFI